MSVFQVAQHIGALDYLLPQEYVQTCKVTHHGAPEQSIEDVYKVMVAELKREVVHPVWLVGDTVEIFAMTHLPKTTEPQNDTWTWFCV